MAFGGFLDCGGVATAQSLFFLFSNVCAALPLRPHRDNIPSE